MGPKKSETKPKTKVPAKAASKPAVVKKVAAKKVAAKKEKVPAAVAAAAYIPLDGFTYMFVDFKDKLLEEKIIKYGGKMNKSLKKADFLICESVDGCAEEVSERMEHTKGKDELESELDEYGEQADKV